MSEIDIFVSSIGNFNIISLDHVMKSKNKACSQGDAGTLRCAKQSSQCYGPDAASRSSTNLRLQLPGLETTFCDPAYSVTEKLPVYHDTALAAVCKIIRDVKEKRSYFDCKSRHRARCTERDCS